MPFVTISGINGSRKIPAEIPHQRIVFKVFF